MNPVWFCDCNTRAFISSGPWTGSTETGNATLAVITGPEIAGRAVHAAVQGEGEQAFTQKTFSPAIALPEGKSLFVGTWIRPHSDNPGSSIFRILSLANTSVSPPELLSVEWGEGGRFRLQVVDDSGVPIWTSSPSADFPGDQWYWLVVELRRANAGQADGRFRLFVNGKLTEDVPGLDTDERFAQLTGLSLGVIASGSDGDGLAFDGVTVMERVYPAPNQGSLVGPLVKKPRQWNLLV